MLHKSQLNHNLLSYFFFQVIELVYSSIFYKFLFFLIVVLFNCFYRNNIDSVYIANCTWDGKRCLGKLVCLASWVEILFQRSTMRFSRIKNLMHAVAVGNFPNQNNSLNDFFFSDINFSKHLNCPMKVCWSELFNSFPIVCKYQLELMCILVKNQSTQLSPSVDNPNTTYKFNRVWYLTKRYCPRQEILCFHCHVIKNKNPNHSIQRVQNLGNESKGDFILKGLWYFICEMSRTTFCPNFIKLCMEMP